MLADKPLEGQSHSHPWVEIALISLWCIYAWRKRDVYAWWHVMLPPKDQIPFRKWAIAFGKISILFAIGFGIGWLIVKFTPI